MYNFLVLYIIYISSSSSKKGLFKKKQQQPNQTAFSETLTHIDRQQFVEHNTATCTKV